MEQTQSKGGEPVRDEAVEHYPVAGGSFSSVAIRAKRSHPSRRTPWPPAHNAGYAIREPSRQIVARPHNAFSCALVAAARKVNLYRAPTRVARVAYEVGASPRERIDGEESWVYHKRSEATGHANPQWEV